MSKSKNRLILLAFIVGLISLSFLGCLKSGKLSEVEYNNAIVEKLNLTSGAIEETTTTYDNSIPNIVTEDSEIDATSLQTTSQSAAEKIALSEEVLTLKSKNSDQEEAVKSEFQNYLALAEEYLKAYDEMLTYYSANTFKENLDDVATYDEKLHIQYNKFIESNNKLVDILADYVE
ncbi:MAG: hypothetical protein ACD_28C00063G0022 [uncultured bacterium]|nr:MAG: hypothetical protein ACD_28C00063G0022 [uncultured bacterium]KKT75112.1 MAG: hypothetical protein UW70_C0039G0043 [Candidatus Peregrinibacteria bacterium GW2011_GWA2_44_7]